MTMSKRAGQKRKAESFLLRNKVVVVLVVVPRTTVPSR